jgi:GNAT superfamily N-acetyltransferase
MRPPSRTAPLRRGAEGGRRCAERGVGGRSHPASNASARGGVARPEAPLGPGEPLHAAEPAERTASVEEVASELRALGAAPNCTILVAETAGKLVGYVEATGGRFRRNRRTAEVVIGVAQAASGRGVGSALMTSLVRWAEDAGVHRLELTVMAHNRRARRLYHKAGFVEEARRAECLQVDGALVDEIYMARLLPATPVPAAAAAASAAGGERQGEVTVSAAHPRDREWIAELLRRRWGSTEVVSRGCIHRAERLPAFVAEAGGERVGLATYRHGGDNTELVTLDAIEGGRGVGSALLGAVIDEARQAGSARLWLITSNDNLDAMGFYQRRGLRLVAVHPGGVDEARLLKPNIPDLGEHQIPLHDEIELEIWLAAQRTGGG